MRRLLVLLLLFSLKFYGQNGNDINKSYDFILKEVQSRTSDYKTDRYTEYYTLAEYSRQYKTQVIIYSFDSKTDECFSINFLYPIDAINDMISVLNNTNFIKLDETIWKDYQSECKFEITKISNGKSFTLKISKY